MYNLYGGYWSVIIMAAYAGACWFQSISLDNVDR